MDGEIELKIRGVVGYSPCIAAPDLLKIARQADERIEQLLQHVENLQRMNESHCSRIVAQSELITKLVEEKRCQAKTVGQSTPTPPNSP